MAGRSLDLYRAKRDPARTPEPFGPHEAASADAAESAGGFVVQQHAARRMHWDFRLEIGNVLVSWAVPKGPSSDPKERRLAVQTEDHPLEYADFEGLIPRGNYGAGAVIIWDRGTYETIGKEDAAAALARGKLDLQMYGHKLRGRWALVRTKSESGMDWLLIKKADGQPTSPELVATQAGSVISGLTIEELQQGVQRSAELATRAATAGAIRRAVDATKLSPMLAESLDKPFSRAGWLFELKYDGVRVLAARQDGNSARLWYRTGRDTTHAFPEIARAVAHLPCAQFILDGEIVALDERGVPSFERLQKRLGQTDTGTITRLCLDVPVAMVCFDLLAVAGYDVRQLPLTARKDLLRVLLPAQGILRFSDHIERDGEALFELATQAGVEGIVAKRADAAYQSGRCSRDWLKIKVQRHADLVVVGYLRGKGSRQALGALMLAWREGADLVYAGNVGTGLDARAIDELLPKLQAASVATPAFRKPPPPARTQVFARPELVVEVRYGEVTAAGALRHPVFLRLRDDKTVETADLRPLPPTPLEPAPVAVAPASQAATDHRSALRLSNLDKVFWPEDGHTKGDLLQYYEAVWPVLQPYLRDRPVVLTRYPNGIAGKSFFQQNAPAFTPDWVQTVHVRDNDYFICNDVETLLYVINSACIPLHVWSARQQSLDRPDWAILDLDPKGAPFENVVTVARTLHGLLSELHTPHFIKTSGQEGVHLLIPLGTALGHTEARLFAEVLARTVVAELPEIATVTRSVNARGGKVYVDYLQNGFGKTIVAPFSVRPRAGAPVSTPLAWAEVGLRLDPKRFTMRTVPLRIRKRGDPMVDVLRTTADIHAVLARLNERLR